MLVPISLTTRDVQSHDPDGLAWPGTALGADCDLGMLRPGYPGPENFSNAAASESSFH